MFLIVSKMKKSIQISYMKVKLYNEQNHLFIVQGGPKRMASLVVSLFSKQIYFIFPALFVKDQKRQRKGTFL